MTALRDTEGAPLEFHQLWELVYSLHVSHIVSEQLPGVEGKDDDSYIGAKHKRASLYRNYIAPPAMRPPLSTTRIIIGDPSNPGQPDAETILGYELCYCVWKVGCACCGSHPSDFHGSFMAMDFYVWRSFD